MPASLTPTALLDTLRDVLELNFSFRTYEDWRNERILLVDFLSADDRERAVRMMEAAGFEPARIDGTHVYGNLGFRVRVQLTRR